MFCRPESLGIVVGIVFLVLAIIFQYFNFTADSNVRILISGRQQVISEIIHYLLNDILPIEMSDLVFTCLSPSHILSL